MPTEHDWMQQRFKLHQLRQAHPDWSFRHYARELNASDKWVRDWCQRFADRPPQSLKDYRGRSRAPKIRPTKMDPFIAEVVGALRETLTEKYHRPAGPTLIRTELQARPELAPFRLPTSTRTITRILHEQGYLQRRRKPKHLPLPLTPPMEEWEMDFCEVYIPDEGKFEFFLVIDRGTSRIMDLAGSTGYNAETALEAVMHLFIQHGLPKRLRFDRDPRFFYGIQADGYPSPLIRFLRTLGIEPVVCPPRRPDLKPFVERLIRTFKYEWLAKQDWFTSEQLREVYPEFVDFYHQERRHFGVACGGKTPDEAFPDLAELPQLPNQVNPSAWLRAYDGEGYTRRVNASGMLQIDKYHYSVGTKYAKHTVLVQIDAARRQYQVRLAGHLIATLDMQGLYPAETADLWDYFRWLKAEARSIEYYRRLKWEQRGEVD